RPGRPVATDDRQGAAGRFPDPDRTGTGVACTGRALCDRLVAPHRAARQCRTGRPGALVAGPPVADPGDPAGAAAARTAALRRPAAGGCRVEPRADHGLARGPSQSRARTAATTRVRGVDRARGAGADRGPATATARRPVLAPARTANRAAGQPVAPAGHARRASPAARIRGPG